MAKKKYSITDKKTPTYSLKDAKELIREENLIILKTVTQTANNMCLTISQAHEEILKLEAVDFYKSTVDKLNHKVWQDVYKKEIGGFPTYIKFKIADGSFVLMSFKSDESK